MKNPKSFFLAFMAMWLVPAIAPAQTEFPVNPGRTPYREVAAQQTMAGDKTLKDKEKPVQVSPVDMPVYKPPLRSAPKGRLAGGSRAPGNSSTKILLLSPDHVGLTVFEQPKIFWFLSGPVKQPPEFTLIESNAVNPVVETRLAHPAGPGIQSIRLSDYGVRLKQGVDYQCYIAIVSDPERRSKDIIASGDIEKIEFPASLNEKLNRAAPTRAPFIYAEEGLWYDALSALSDMIEKDAGQTSCLRQRAALLNQVGLREAADFELKRISSGK